MCNLDGHDMRNDYPGGNGGTSAGFTLTTAIQTSTFELQAPHKQGRPPGK